MRKLWCAGAMIAGGIFLVTASPAQADRADVDSPVLSELMPNGPTGTFTDRPTRMFGGGVPLLGGLGGLRPANESPRTPPTDDPDLSGMPAGGLVVPPVATDGTPSAAPAPSRPARVVKPGKPRPVATPDDPRLHEEPVDIIEEPPAVVEEPVPASGEPVPATGEPVEHRPFSEGGRPVAGVDEQYR